MLLLRTESDMGTRELYSSFSEPNGEWGDLCVSGRHVEPAVNVKSLLEALNGEDVQLRSCLHPKGYEETVRAYQKAASLITKKDLDEHYRDEWFQKTFVPHLKWRLQALSGGVWDFKDYVAYAAGSDVDLMTHLVQGRAVAVYPGDWYGFIKGVSSTHPKINMDAMSVKSDDRMACLCVPSVRNGHITAEMLSFLERADSALLNINLYPTLPLVERINIARHINPYLLKSLISISFSRGFGLTASQLGVLLVHQNHPIAKEMHEQLSWLTYFYNKIAATALMHIDQSQIDAENNQRRWQTEAWLTKKGLPVIRTGSYYVKSFHAIGRIPDSHLKLNRHDKIVRLCF